MEVPTPESDSPPRLQFDLEWLAITRAFHPWLSLTPNQRPLPSHEEGKKLIEEARKWIEENVVKREMPMKAGMPAIEAVAPVMQGVDEQGGDEVAEKQEGQDQSVAPEVKPFGPLDVEGVQVFQPTAPAEFCGPAFPGKHVFLVSTAANAQADLLSLVLGLSAPGQWFTNRQTEELCKLLGVPNRINPLPTGV
jgi:lariat debranching enzyme